MKKRADGPLSFLRRALVVRAVEPKKATTDLVEFFCGQLDLHVFCDNDLLN